MTLGSKAAAEDASYRTWQPIKSFPTDATSAGLHRLIDVMSSFGADLVGDAILSSSDAGEDAQLGAAFASETARMNHRFMSEYRAVVE